MKFCAASLLALIGVTSAFAPTARVSRSTSLDARKPFISGNWKLNPQTREEAVTLATEISSAITDASPDADVALFVPYVFIEAAMGSVGGKLSVGAEVSGLSLSTSSFVSLKVCSLAIFLLSRVFVPRLREHSLVLYQLPCFNLLAFSGH